jgi:BMFP domain-containing protein YqiC
MSRTAWLGLGLLVSIASGLALAAPVGDSTTDARLRALEKRVSDLEQQSTEAPSAELERRVSALEKKVGAGGAAATAAAPTNLEQRVSTLEQKTTVAPAAVAAAPAVPAGPPRWQDHKNWAALNIGMTWSQVKQILGVPGKVKAGVFGDVMYFPDGNGGSVEFDRDGRVAKWSEKGGD